MSKKFPIAQVTLFGIFAVAAISMLLYTDYSNDQLRKTGAYTIGYISEVTPAKNGIIYTCKYGYAKDSLTYSFSAMGLGFKEGHILFVEFVPTKLSICKVLYEVKVPACMTLQSVPVAGWTELPTDSCK